MILFAFPNENVFSVAHFKHEIVGRCFCMQRKEINLNIEQFYFSANISMLKIILSSANIKLFEFG